MKISGLAFFDAERNELRCAAPRTWFMPNNVRETRTCTKLIAKTNRSGELKGNFKCYKCNQVVEVS